MKLQPGFVDEKSDTARAAQASDTEAVIDDVPLPREPVLLEVNAAAPEGQIDPSWEPDLVVPKRSAGVNSLTWLAAGVFVLIAGWLVLSGIGFVADQFHRSLTLGVITFVVFASGIALISRAVLSEANSYRSLRCVDGLREALQRVDATPAGTKALCRQWVSAVGGKLADVEATMTAVERATTVSEIRSALLNLVIERLQQAARKTGRRAALQGGAVVAVTPSPALDGLFAGLRAIVLIREVAQLYGLRPGVAVTFTLLRRVAWTAAAVSSTELIARGLADQVLQNLPVIKHLAGAVPGTSIAAIRLYRLAGITAEACSPLANG
jgi:putative membrane protein